VGLSRAAIGGQRDTANAVKLGRAVLKGDGAMRAFREFSIAAALATLVVAALVPTVSAGTPIVRGIDVSHHNGQPDWSAVKADGIDFAFAKATEGSTFQDSEYARNRNQAEAAGVAFGAYHFARPGTAAGDATADANAFVDFAQLTDDNLLPVLDLENSGGLGVRKLKRWAKEWVRAVDARLGVKPMIYTTASFWKNHMGRTAWFANNGYRLWVAHWTTADAPKMPAANWAGNGWTVWQYSNQGSVAGIGGDVDLDRYNGGDIDQLRIKNNR
jgi:GH25 family lysozyme M1 (1,4-beta-N-acetylmuramidase)